jgi:hypothetical protein
MICSWLLLPVLPAAAIRRRGTVSGLARRPPHGTALTRATHRLQSCPTLGGGALVVITAAGPAPEHRTHHCRAQAPPPNPTAAGPDNRRVLSRVGAADHAVTPKAPWTGPAGVDTSMAGSGEAITTPPAFLPPPARSSQPALSAGKRNGYGCPGALTCQV